MKLVIIISGLGIGGAEFSLLNTVERLYKEIDIHVISLSDVGFVGDKLLRLGVPVHALRINSFFSIIPAVGRLMSLLRSIKPNVVHTWMYHADLIGGLASRLAGVKSVVWALHNCDLSKERNKSSTRMVVKACALLSRWLPQRILSCSEKAVKVHVSEGYSPRKMVVIPNGFDLSRFAPNSEARNSVRDELGLPINAQLVGLIARDDPQKNHIGFIEAAGRVGQCLPYVHFLLAGTHIDESNSNLLEKIAQTPIKRHFHLLGRREDIPRLMAALDVLASPSFGEAFPMVLGEAMSCGVPCVVTNVGDCAEIVGDTGRIVEAGDMAGFGDRLIELLLLAPSERQAIGFRARDRIKQRYDIDEVAKQYKALYLELFSNQDCDKRIAGGL